MTKLSVIKTSLCRSATFLLCPIIPLLGFLYFFLTPATPTSAQQNTLTNSMQFAEYVNSLRDSAHSILSALDSTVGNNLFRSRQHLEILINQIEAVAMTTAAKTLSDLSAMERKFFINVRQQLNELSSQTQITMLDIEQLSANVSSGIRNLPFANTFPVVFRYDPLFVVDKGRANRNEIIISIHGAQLSAFEPSLTIENERCARIKKIDTSLSFSCNKDLFLASETIESYSGKLVVYQTRSFWDRLLSRDALEYFYDISIEVIPRILGKADIVVSYKTTNIKRSHRKEKFSYLNGHCHGSKHQLFAFNSRQSWKIDPNSIVAKCRSSSKSACNGLRNVQEKSFGYACRIQNRGKCGPLWKDARGSCYGTVEWDEVNENEEVQAKALKPIQLTWGKDISIDLPEKTHRVRLTIDRVDGTRSVLTESKPEDLWVRADFDIPDRLVVLRPKDVETVMRLGRGK